MLPRTFLPVLLLLAPVLAAQDASPSPAFYDVPVVDLPLAEGTRLPSFPSTLPWDAVDRYWSLWPYAVLEGEGEAWYSHPNDGPSWQRPGDLDRGRLHVRATGDGDVRGTLYVPDAQWKSMVPLAFTLPAARSTANAETPFLRARAIHYAHLNARALPGAAWFRHVADEARAELGEEGEIATLIRTQTAVRPTELDDTLALFSGGRALSENIQLDRILPEGSIEGEMVEVASITGITVQEMDWTALLAGAAPELDPLAHLVPADQHALFFPSFGAMTRLADEAAVFGAPVLNALADDSRDARTRERYEEQLCLSLDALTRRFGALAVASVTCTGSDPYLRTGSDVAILFEARNAGILVEFIRARHDAVRKAAADVEPVEGEVAGVHYEGIVSPTRRVCSYLATVDGAVVVTNSLPQLERIAITAGDVNTSLGALDEYRFFRDRYDRNDADETALLVVPDAAIRRWCGPRWRIATSRRTSAAAALAELEATHLLTRAAGIAKPRPIETLPDFPVLGNLHLTPDGVHSQKYGTLGFQTPIAELPLTHVSKAEANLYERWRDGYQRNWSGVFDPIALRFTVQDGEVGIDLSILPLIASSEYREMIALVGDAQLGPDSADPHPETLFHFAMAIDPDSKPMREIGSFLSEFGEQLGANPLSWVGNSLAVYFDRDEIWEELAMSEDWEELQENLYVDINEIPVVLYVEVQSGLKLAAFLSSIRAFVDGSSPGLLQWATREHGERKYVEIKSQDIVDDISIFYATLPNAFLLSLHEETLKRAIDRLTAKPGEGEADAPVMEPWPGRSAAVDVNAAGLRMFQMVFDDDWGEQTRLLSWANLPILNEWRRRFPDRDPLAVHEELWGERLVCPAGGEYVWNEAWGTMQSTAAGHPGEPGENRGLPAILSTLKRARLGLTFEHDGLRAVVRLARDS